MKKFIPLFLFASLAIATTVSAVEANTDPVGFVSVTVAANSDAPFSLSLNRPAALQTTVSAVATNTITLNATLTASQFVYAAGTQTNKYFASIKSTVNTNSTVNGKWFEVTANTTTAITVDPASVTSVQAQGLAAGDTVEIIPFWSFNTLFPSGGGLTATSNIDVPQDLVLLMPQTVAGTNLASAKSYMYVSGSGDLSDGWYNANTFDPVGDDILIPDTYFVVRNRGVAQDLTVVGAVPFSAKTSNLVRLSAGVKQDNFSVNPYPVPLSFTETNLVQSGAFEATTDIDNPKDILLVYDGTETGFNAQPSKAYIYSTDLSNLGAVGWYNANTFDGPLDNSKILQSGRGFIIRKASGAVAEFNWKMPRPF